MKIHEQEIDRLNIIVDELTHGGSTMLIAEHDDIIRIKEARNKEIIKEKDETIKKLLQKNTNLDEFEEKETQTSPINEERIRKPQPREQPPTEKQSNKSKTEKEIKITKKHVPNIIPQTIIEEVRGIKRRILKNNSKKEKKEHTKAWVVYPGEHNCDNTKAIKSCVKINLNQQLCRGGRNAGHQPWECTCKHIKEWKTVQVKGVTYHIIEGSTHPKIVNAIERSFLDEKLKIIRTDSDTWHQTLDSINMEKKKAKKTKTAFIYNVEESIRIRTEEKIQSLIDCIRLETCRTNPKTMVLEVEDTNENQIMLNKLKLNGINMGNKRISIDLDKNETNRTNKKIHIKKDVKKEGIYSCSTIHNKKTINFTIYQCTWCLSMEHHFKNCKCPEEKLKNGICQEERISHPSCNKCLKIHRGSQHPKDDKTPTICINCRGNHQATDIRCPKIQEKAEEILKIRIEKMKENKVKHCNTCGRYRHTSENCWLNDNPTKRAGDNRRRHNMEYTEKKKRNPYNFHGNWLNDSIEEARGMKDNNMKIWDNPPHHLNKKHG